MSNEFVRVPPGHKVVVIHPSPQPQMGVTESKLVVLDFGSSGDWRTLLAKVETSLLGGAFPTTITILQMAMIDRLVTAGELSAFVAGWQSAKQKGWNAVWVLPNKASESDVVVDLLKNAGFGEYMDRPRMGHALSRFTNQTEQLRLGWPEGRCSKESHTESIDVTLARNAANPCR